MSVEIDINSIIIKTVHGGISFELSGHLIHIGSSEIYTTLCAQELAALIAALQAMHDRMVDK